MTTNSTVGRNSHKPWAVPTVLHDLGYETFAALCWVVSACLWILGDHHRKVARTVQHIDFYRPRRNTLLYNTLGTFKLSWFLAPVLLTGFALLCTFPEVSFDVLFVTGLVTAFGVTDLMWASEDLCTLYPSGIQIDVGLWQHIYDLLPAIVYGLQYGGYIDTRGVLLLRSMGMEPELWSYANRPDPPEVVWAREDILKMDERRRQAEKFAEFEAEFQARWELKAAEWERQRHEQVGVEAAELMERKQVSTELTAV